MMLGPSVLGLKLRCQPSISNYYIDPKKPYVASELAAISLIRDAYLHNKLLNLWWDDRDPQRRWLKAVDLHG